MSSFEDTSTRILINPRHDRDLEDWLQHNRLSFLHEPLRVNGFDDFNLLLDTMRSAVPLTKEMIAPFCGKPGYAARFLGLLELEARGGRDNYLQEGSFWCTGSTLAEHEDTIEEWLHHLNIGDLLENFQTAGYDDLEHLKLLQKTKVKLTDEVLEHELGISVLGWRHRILMRLWQDTEVPLKIIGAKLEDSSKLAKCKDCVLM